MQDELNYGVLFFIVFLTLFLFIEYIGFGSLPDIVHRKTVKKGFEFTLMVVGESGLGKSTLINTLFLSDLYKERKEPSYGIKKKSNQTFLI